MVEDDKAWPAGRGGWNPSRRCFAGGHSPQFIDLITPTAPIGLPVQSVPVPAPPLSRPAVTSLPISAVYTGRNRDRRGSAPAQVSTTRGCRSPSGLHHCASPPSSCAADSPSPALIRLLLRLLHRKRPSNSLPTTSPSPETIGLLHLKKLQGHLLKELLARSAPTGYSTAKNDLFTGGHLPSHRDS
ncbi:hypothetical protein E2562_017451 [Oryza meyeriana var. granulata]|uniref:Uncharacterized protein n=1 Tax=Oryza meyeriana var. granulata TaxID=110450 RepID=A0A6G1DZZ8_9ORYZ|nr:hypothetical protein E2562_017451 [Oryza meyeriana var. granulata]KAF0917275.1 hypothetical protein E2562_017451 [Oryza meyeriana var. granulata]